MAIGLKSNKKKTILIVHNYYKIPGGEDTVVANELKLLQEYGHKVILYTRTNKELGRLSFCDKMLLPVNTIFNYKVYKEIKNIIKVQKIDLIHVHNTLNRISPSVYYAAIHENIPVVQTMHNFRLLCPNAEFYRDGHICQDCVDKSMLCSLRHKCYRNSFVQTLACVISTKFHRIMGIYRKINFICLTEFNKNMLLLLNSHGKQVIDKKKVYVKPNFSYSFMKSNYCGNGRYYLFIGRIEQIKGIGLLIDAFSNLPQFELKVAGTGSELEQMKRKATGNVEFLGYVKRERLSEIIKGAKAVIVASQWYETFGMIIAEAYSAGKPVIAGNIGNIASLVEEGCTGFLFKYNSSEALIKAINKFEESRDTDWEYQVIRKYQEEFSPEVNYTILNQIYENIGR